MRRPAAFGELFDRHAGVVGTYLLRRVGATEAEDLAAETFVQAFTSRHRYDLSLPNALPWLFGIASNLLRRHRRTERRKLAALTRTAQTAPRVSGESEDRWVESLAAREAIARGLLRLAARDREALLLHAWAGLSYEGVALALGVPLGTVKSRIARARRTLRELLEASGQEMSEA